MENFENLRRSYDYQPQIFQFSWNLETFIYKSWIESWIYECFACIQILLITPSTSAKVDRMFSQMERIKIDWRIHLGRDRLDSLLRLSEEGQSLEKFNPTSANDRWFNDKVRCLTSSSHKYPGKRRRLQEKTVVHTATLKPCQTLKMRKTTLKIWLNIVYSSIELLLYNDKKVKYLIIQGLNTCTKFRNHLSFILFLSPQPFFFC